MAKRSDNDVFYVRLPIDLRSKVEDHRAELQRDVPIGMRVTTSAAIRSLLEQALTKSTASAA